MDIDYLLVLQELREAAGPLAEQFFLMVSSVLVGAAMVAVPMVIYWCLDKRRGMFVFLSFSASSLINNLIKSIACVQRPWIRDSRIHPSEAALEGATGYSFPSGHSQSAMSIYGGAGWEYRKKSIWAPILGALLVALVAFSRNFLGVHTPQDIVVAILETALIIWLVEIIIPILEAMNAKQGLGVVAAALLITGAYLALCTLKPYPVLGTTIATVAGQELDISAYSMVLDAYESAGLFLGVVLGWWIEQNYVGFSTEASKRGKLLRVVIGIVLVVVVRYVVAAPLGALLGETWKDFLKSLLPVVVGIAGFPALFERLDLFK